MLSFRVCRKVQKFRCFHFTVLCFQSTLATASKKICNITKRKYSKPKTALELEFFSDSFLTSLFSGFINKSIFQYPPVLREEDIDIALNHSAVIEEFFIKNPNCLVNKNILEELAKLEVFGLSLPQEYGGAGYNETESKFLLECTAAAPAVARFLSYNENFGCKILNKFGSENQKNKYLPGLAAGKSFISFAYLESVPLIDLTKFEGYVFFDNDKKHYILNAEKKWVHSADQSDLFLVMVKLPEFSDDVCEIKFKMFIVERNTPGVTVHQPKSQKALEMGVFDVSFNNIHLPLESALGETTDVNGFTVLKYGLTHCHVGDAVVCLHLVKRFINDSIQLIQDKQDSKNLGLLNDNLACLVMNAYALESVIYLIAGRFDMYENPDLFDESVLAKIIAIECVQNAIQNYIQIFQRDSLKQSGPLEEVLNAWQFYSVFDENIEYLKLLIASEGLIHGARYLHKVPNAFLNPYDNIWEVIKWKLFSKKSLFKKHIRKQNFQLELNHTFSESANMLDLNFAKLLSLTEEFFVKYKDSALSNETIVIKFAEISAYIYATIACLSRASSAVCYDFDNFEDETKLAKSFTEFATTKIDWLIDEKIKNEKFKELYRVIGKATFKWKGYPAEHPLSRTF